MMNHYHSSWCSGSSRCERSKRGKSNPIVLAWRTTPMRTTAGPQQRAGLHAKQAHQPHLHSRLHLDTWTLRHLDTWTRRHDHSLVNHYQPTRFSICMHTMIHKRTRPTPLSANITPHPPAHKTHTDMTTQSTTHLHLHLCRRSTLRCATQHGQTRPHTSHNTHNTHNTTHDTHSK